MKITIVGFGYIGSVISAVLAVKGYKVTAIDKNKNRIDKLNKGICNIPEPNLKKMILNCVKSGNLKGSTSYKGVNFSDVILVTVGTSLSNEFDADLNALNDVFKSLSKHLTKNQILMIKSTVPPGITRKLAKDYFCLNKKISIGFSPERLAEGNAIKELKELPIIVGGINKKSTERCAKFWQSTLGVEVIKVSNPETAELVKLANNQWIDTNIALANEFAMLCDSLPYKIDVLEIIKGANSLKKGQSYVNFMTPSVGVGGYCLTKDPWFVSTLGKKNNIKLKLPASGRSINDNMPSYCVNQITNFLKKKKLKFKNIKIAILGYSFKNNSGDIRYSPMIDFVNKVFDEGFCKINVFDSLINLNESIDKRLIRKNNWQECVKNAQVVVFGAAHDDIKSINIKKLSSLIKKKALIFDGRRYFNKRDINTIKKLGIKYLGVGR